MKNFRIYTDDNPELTPSFSTEVLPGTRYTFRNISGRIKAAMSIPVTIIA